MIQTTGTADAAQQTVDVAKLFQSGSALYAAPPTATDPATAFRLNAHRMVHPRGLAGCPYCPPTVCACGSATCDRVAQHQRWYAGSESTWMESAR